jgi:hypothetical protein
MNAVSQDMCSEQATLNKELKKLVVFELFIKEAKIARHAIRISHTFERTTLLRKKPDES